MDVLVMDVLIMDVLIMDVLIIDDCMRRSMKPSAAKSRRFARNANELPPPSSPHSLALAYRRSTIADGIRDARRMEMRGRIHAKETQFTAGQIGWRKRLEN
jgi:hypothetical protein